MNPLIQEVPPSLIRSINALKRPDDIDFGLGEPTIPPDIESFAAALEWTRLNGSPYSPNAGLPELREAIAGYLGSDPWKMGRPGSENVCVTVGSEEALYLGIKTLIDPARDEVLIVEPCYLAYPKICVLEGIRNRTVALDGGSGFSPSAATVLEAIRPETRLLILNTPSNPTGRVWSPQELKALAEGLAERGGEPVYVLADEVYRELYYDAAPPESIARYHPWTLVAGSLSKSNALTGLRVGWLVGPKDVIDAATKVHQFVNTSTATFAQRVAVDLFSRPGSLASHRPQYGAVRERLLVAAAGCGIEMIEPQGAFYAFIRLPASLRANSLDAARRLLSEARVVAVPGLAFGESGEGWLRISWVLSAERVEEGITRIGEWLDRSV